MTNEIKHTPTFKEYAANNPLTPEAVEKLLLEIDTWINKQNKKSLIIEGEIYEATSNVTTMRHGFFYAYKAIKDLQSQNDQLKQENKELREVLESSKSLIELLHKQGNFDNGVHYSGLSDGVVLINQEVEFGISKIETVLTQTKERVR